MLVEYRWFKNGKEFMYTSDLEGKDVTKEFWDNGNVKYTFSYTHYTNAYITKIYNRDGKFIKEIRVVPKRKTIQMREKWVTSDCIKLDLMLNTAKGTGERTTFSDGLEGVTESLNNEPYKIEKNTTNVKLRWDNEVEKDNFLNDKPPAFVSFEPQGNSIQSIVNLEYYNSANKDANILYINYKKMDTSTVVYRDEDRIKQEVKINQLSELSELPNNISEEITRYMEKLVACRDYYVDKYLNIDNSEDEDIQRFLKRIKTITGK